MRILDRYIAMAAFRAYALVLTMLLALFSFLAFLEQLEDVGDGNYRTVDALVYVMLTIPGRTLDLSPVTTLLGGLVAIGMLARNSELIVMRTAGVSVARLGWAFLKPAIVFMLALVLMSEFATPRLHQSAERLRATATSDIGALLSSKGLWSRDGLHFINIRQFLHGRVPARIDLYVFDDDGKLRSYTHAQHADIMPGGRWRLVDVEHKRAEGLSFRRQHLPTMEWRPFWTEEQMSVLQMPPSSLSLSGLYEYIQYLRRSDQTNDRIELSLWQRLNVPLSAAAMAFLAVPFGFGPTRSAGFSRQISIGIFIGIAFYLANQIVANLGLLLELSGPAIAIALPVTVILAGVLALRRVH